MGITKTYSTDIRASFPIFSSVSHFHKISNRLSIDDCEEDRGRKWKQFRTEKNEDEVGSLSVSHNRLRLRRTGQKCRICEGKEGRSAGQSQISAGREACLQTTRRPKMP